MQAQAGPLKILKTPSDAYFADRSVCAEADKIRCYRNIACPSSYRLGHRGGGYLCSRTGTVGSKRKPWCEKHKRHNDWKYDPINNKCVRKTVLGKRQMTNKNIRCPSKLRLNTRTDLCEVAPFALPMLVDRNKPAPFHPVFGTTPAKRFVACRTGYTRNAKAPYGFICQAPVQKSNKTPKGRVYRVPGVS
jgi:hypothetical protein